MTRMLTLTCSLAACVAVATLASACDPKNDPGCDNYKDTPVVAKLVPLADPISTPGAKLQPKAPCNPKTDPGCRD